MNAEQIVGQLRAKPSTDDVVVVWFSQAVTVDFIVAGAYPWLRPEYAAQTRDDGAHAHFLQPWQAAGVLGYVERRVTAGGRQLGNAMRALSRNIRAAIIEAEPPHP